MNPIKQLFRRRELYDDLSEEIRQHLDERADELTDQGMSPRKARAQARREFGNVLSLEERGREVWQWPRLEDLLFDVRYALRQLRREPSFALVAILILGLGIGATTAVFSVVNAVLLRPLPFKEPERLVRVANTGSGGLSSITSRSSNLRDWARLNHTFEDLAGYFAFFDYERFTLVGTGEPERLVGVGVTETFLDTLGVRPMLGRNFTPEECVWNGRPAVILTDSFWQLRFGGDPSIVGKSLMLSGSFSLNDDGATVVGVLPKSFDFASFFSPGSRIDFLQPFAVSGETDRWGNTLAIIGRLKPGVTIADAQADLDVVNEQLLAAEPGRWELGAAVSSLREYFTGGFRDALILLAVAVCFVLLIACTNLSNLLLARAATRRKEIAVRSAVGAGRQRLIRQMLTEAFVLAGCGGVLGVATAYALTRGVAATQAVTIPLLQSTKMDSAALGFALVVVVGTGLLFGIVPALQVSASRANDTLRDSGRGVSEGRSHAWIRSSLVVSQVALACMLLVGAGLLLRSFMSLLDADLGFHPEQRVTWRAETTRRFQSLTEKARFYEQLTNRVGTIPGIESVGLTDTVPLGRNRTWGLRAKGVVYGEGEQPLAFPHVVSPGYIGAIGIRLVQGRDFTAHDTTQSERVALLNQAAAQRLWPNQDAIGRKIQLFDDWTVVGVVANVRQGSLEDEPSLEMYFPIAQQADWSAVDLVVRTRLPLQALVPAVRSAMREIDDTMATDEHQPLSSIVERAVSPRRFIVSLLGAFAVAALVLASLGIYGVISYSVSRRTQEIGIRMALGASAQNVRLQLMKGTLGLTAAGIVLGITGALAVSQLMASLLYGVTATDPWTFGGTISILALVAAAAGYLPARRASRIHPMTALQKG